MHITASVFINDDESGLHHDYGAWLEKMAPHEPVSQYRHNDTGEDNADAHIKRQIMGRSEEQLAARYHKAPWAQVEPAPVPPVLEKCDIRQLTLGSELAYSA